MTNWLWSYLSNGLSQLIDLLHLTFWVVLPCWLPVEVRVSCKIFVQVLNIVWLLLIIPQLQENQGWYKLTGNWRRLPIPLNSLYESWLMWFLQSIFYLSWAAVKDIPPIQWKSGKEDFPDSGIPVELISYPDPIDYAIKLRICKTLTMV